jgi:hypothetical protein
MVTFKSVTTGMMCASLILNIAVLCAICPGIMAGEDWAEFAYGARTVARDILLSMYFSILVSSFVLLVVRDERMVAALLIVQIIYKLAAPFAAWTVSSVQSCDHQQHRHCNLSLCDRRLHRVEPEKDRDSADAHAQASSSSIKQKQHRNQRIVHRLQAERVQRKDGKIECLLERRNAPRQSICARVWTTCCP